MKYNLRHIFFVLLFLLPVLAIDAGYFKILEIVEHWQDSEQERYAIQKLGELSSNLNFSQHLAAYSESFNSRIRSVLEEVPKAEIKKLNWNAIANSAFASPFPRNDLWVFHFDESKDRSDNVFNNVKTHMSRRSMEMVFSYFMALESNSAITPRVRRRNEKLLKKIFGNGSTGELLVEKQRGIATPVIYNSIPSWLIWDFQKGFSGQFAGFFIIVPRDQDLKSVAFKCAKKDTGLGKDYAGGFIRLFESGSPDSFFPPKIASFTPFADWRAKIGLCNAERLWKWQKEGFPWGDKLGNYKLFTRISPTEKHLLFMLLPTTKSPAIEKLMFAFNLFVISLIVLLLARGLIFDVWPGFSIKSRFVLVFSLAVTLPLVLYTVFSVFYVFDRLKADEKILEDTLASSLRDFDAGKEQLEKDYRSSFRACLKDERINQRLLYGGLKDENELFRYAIKNFEKNGKQLPLVGLAMFDLDGKQILRVLGGIPEKDFKPLVGFYAHNIQLNLRRIIQTEEPEFQLPKFVVDQKTLVAYQAYGRENDSMERELERFRGKIFRTQFGRGKIVTQHDFIQINGKNRYALLICWLDADVDGMVLARSADLLAVKNPSIAVAGFKNTPEGRKLAFKPDRSFNLKKINLFQRVADAAFSNKSGLMRTTEGGLSLVAYSSPSFFNTILVAGIDYHTKDWNHILRLLFFAGIGVLSVFVLIASGLITYFRIVFPLEGIKKTLDQVSRGKFSFEGDTARVDELGALNVEFKRMISGLEEREKLASILSENALEAISVDDLSLKAQQMNGVVLITDIRDFTALGEKHEPGVLTEMLNKHFAEMAKIIVLNGGRIYKFIGDAIESVFIEDPKYATSPELRSLKASMAMLEQLKEINHERERKHSFSYRIGIGLSCGDIISGQTGSIETRLEYAMLGKPFQKAELFESLTKQFGTFPIVVDKQIVEANSKLGIEFEEHNYAGEQIFSVKCVETSFLEEDTEIDSAEISLIESEQDDHHVVNSVKETDFWNRLKSCRHCVFFIGLICLILPFLAIIQTGDLKVRKQQNQKEKIVAQRIKSSLMKVGVADLRAMLEEVLQQESDMIVNRLNWSDSGVSSDSLRVSASQMMGNLKTVGLIPTQMAVLHKPGGSSTQEIANDWQLVFFKGLQSNEEICQDLLQKFAKTVCRGGYQSIKEIRGRLPLLLGLNIGMAFLYNDLHARVTSIKRLGVEEFLYWQPLLLRNPDYKLDLKKDLAKSLRSRPPPEAILPVGTLLLTIEMAHVHKQFLSILKQIFKIDKVSYAVRTESGEVSASPDFPIPSSEIGMTGKLPVVEGWRISDQIVQFEDKKIRVLAGLPLKQVLVSKSSQLFLPILIFLLLVLAWYLAVYRDVGIARSFSWQLWIGLLSAAVIPVVAVYSVNEWNALDREKLSLTEERVKLLNLFEKLERRQTLHEFRAWEKIKDVCFDPYLKKQMDKIDISPSAKNKEKLEQMVQDLTSKNKIRFSEMIVFSNVGWQQSVYPRKIARETGEFKKFIQTFPNDYFANLGSSKRTNIETLGSAVKGEMTRDAGLEIFRNLFGSDIHFSLVHGLDLPVRIFAATGVACLRLIPAPRFLKPDRIFFWLFLDNMNSALRQVFEYGESEYPIFTESKVMYGTLKQPREGGWVPDLCKFSRWAVSTKAPLSMNTKIGDANFQVEARIGKYNEVMLMIGLIPVDQVLAKVEENRRFLLLALLASMLAIVLIALILAADITNPIKELTIGAKNVSKRRYDYKIPVHRQDELGQLLSRFNSMTRGLQEKELMGKMVSNSAKMIAADETSRRAAEEGMRLDVTVMYIAVPGFSMFLETLQTNELIGELKTQIDVLCRIIIENGGDIDKMMGEKILAVFYGKEGLDDSVRSAINTIEQIRGAERLGNLSFPVTAGIHCGTVIAGLLGIGNHRDFTVIGDSVNTAARICSKAAELPRERFLVSGNLAERIRNTDIELRDHGEVELKGKAGTIKLFQLFFKR